MIGFRARKKAKMGMAEDFLYMPKPDLDRMKRKKMKRKIDEKGNR